MYRALLISGTAAFVAAVTIATVTATSRPVPTPAANTAARASAEVGFRQVAASPAPPAAPAVPAATVTATVNPILTRYCVGCHNNRTRTAELTLEGLDLTDVTAHAEVLEKVVRKLRSRSMPPIGMPRPEEATYVSAVKVLETELDRAMAANPNPGRSVAHRLNRAEYANVIRDLLALDVDVRTLLPADDAGYGFDNNADVLTFSPLLLERYLSAARAISRRAVGDSKIRPAQSTYKLPEAPVLMQTDRMGEDLPFGTRGGLAIRHHFPVDGEYEIKIKLQHIRDGQGEIRGLYEPHDLDVRLDGRRLKLFTVGRTVEGTDPESVSTSLNDVGPAYDKNADSDLQVRFSAKAGTRAVTVAFIKTGYKPEAATLLRVTDFGFLRNKGGQPDVDSVEIGGPYMVSGVGDTPSRRAIFVCQPSTPRQEQPCAEKILSQLARRAYRRAVTKDEIQSLLQFYEEGRRDGGFESGIEASLVRMLVDPDFLFRMAPMESRPAAAAVHRISDLDLASRLSFFLWSSIPDPQLLDVAIRGELSDPATLERQVRRMLKDDRAKALVANFAGQWLHLRNLRSHSPNREMFPNWDENLREAFQQETELFVESVIREDRSTLDLLTADYTFVNERLARFYGIPNVYGSHFRRVALGQEHVRGGVLGHGSVLTVSSYATRTSPVIRGKWILENILGAPPPPPPPNVPELKENGEGGKRLSMRAAMELHRRNPACASCHSRMDPLGFALENFDAVGEWRTHDSGETIDASGALPDGSKFAGASELRRALLNHREEFVMTVAEKLLTYALGRGLEYYDAPAIRRINREAATSDYSWSSLILAIVRSVPFQMRTIES